MSSTTSSSRSAPTSIGTHLDRAFGAGPNRGQDRVDQAVQTVDLAEGALVPLLAQCPTLRIAARPAVQWWVVGEQVGVGAHDRQGRAQLVGHHRNQLGSSLVEALQGDHLGLGIALEAALLDDPGQEVGDRAELGCILGVEVAMGLGLDIEHAHDLGMPGQGNGQHRCDIAALVNAAHPQEALVLPDVGHDHGLLAGGHPPGHALPERHPRTANLVTVEPVRCGQGQMAAVAIEQVQRADVGVERVASLVHDRLEQLVPGPGRRGQTGNAMQEAQLPELLLGRSTRRGHLLDHGLHGTGGSSGCLFR